MAKQVTTQEYVQIYQDRWSAIVADSLIELGDKLEYRTYAITKPVSATTTPFNNSCGLSTYLHKGEYELENPTPPLSALAEKNLWARLKLAALSNIEDYFRQWGDGQEVDWVNLVADIDDIEDLDFNWNGGCVMDLNPYLLAISE